MSRDGSGSASGGIGALGMLGCIFVTLKLLGKIDWSWWLVTAPFWFPFSVLIIILIVYVLYKAWRMGKRR
jgi:hypothetical protein